MASDDKNTVVFEDVFTRWAIYTQLLSIAFVVLLTRLPDPDANKNELMQSIVALALTWLWLSAYVYPFIILGCVLSCDGPMRKILFILVAGILLICTQVFVLVAVH